MPGKEDSLSLVEEDMSPADLKDLYAQVGVTDESLRRDAAALRGWIIAQPHLPNVTSDVDEWLKMFLLASKNSMEKAKVRLENYFSNRSALGDWFVLPPQPEDEALVNEADYMLGGYMPKLLPGGYLLILEKVVLPADGNWSRFDMNLHYRRALLQVEAVLGRCKPIRGVVFLMDEKHISMSVASNFLATLAGFRRVMSCVQDAMPIRLQAIHTVNAPAASLQRTLLSAVTPLLKDKLGERIFIHNNLESLHKHIPRDCLPEEYGGTHPATMECLTRTLNNFILSKREWYKSREWMKADEERRLIKKPSDYGLEGSFRKLAVD